MYKNDSCLEFFRSTDKSEPFKEFREFCKNYEPEGNAYYRFGYETFGVILYNFNKWLMEKLREKDISQVFFFSRDGYIIKKAFELIPGNEDFRQNYIYVSRRSLRVPTLWFNEDTRLNAIFPTKYISIRDLLSSIGLDSYQYKEIINHYGLNEDTIIRGEDIDKNQQVVGLLDSIWNDVEKQSWEEYELVIKYLQSFNLNERIACVDIGWRGTMQNYLNILLKKSNMNISTMGYYITLNSDLLPNVDMQGFLMNVDNKGNGCDLLRGYVGLIETLFLRTEGSTKKYDYTEEKGIVPILEKYEYLDNENYSFEAKAVEEIQKGALEFIKDYVDSGMTYLKRFDDILTFSNLQEFATKPTQNDIKMFGGFRFYNNGTVSHLAKANNIVYYLFHLGQLKEDFYGSRWRIGFMKNVFKVPLPYSKIMEMIMKIV